MSPSRKHNARMYPGTETHLALRALAERQHGALHRDQLRRLAVSPARVSSQLAARRWTAWGAKVVLLQNARPSRDQLMWLAVLDAGPLSALGSHTSLELAGFKSFAREATKVHLIVPRGSRATRFTGVQLHESRRLHPGPITRTQGLPRTETARSTIDAAAWQPYPRFACLMLAAAVQQRVTTAAELDQALRFVGRVRHKAYLRLVLGDIARGAESLGEIDLAGVCTRFGLVHPTRQVKRRDSTGRLRYLDAEWRLPTGEVVVLEVDGSHHLDIANWQADMRRERSIVVSRRWVLRATAFEVRLEPGAIVADLIAMGIPAARTTPDLSALRVARAS